MTRCYKEIDLEIINNNYLTYKNKICKDRKIIAVVKADAYGHGAVNVALSLNRVGCRDFAVSNIDEAIELRKGGVNGHILVMGYTPSFRLSELIKYDVAQSLISAEYAKVVLDYGKKVKVHIAIDTGMNRFGLDYRGIEEIKSLAEKCRERLDLYGIYTHLCTADDEEQSEFIEEQIERFNAIVKELDYLDLRYIHCLNSAGGIINSTIGNAVRLGIILYGLRPSYNFSIPEGIRPALKWKSEVIDIKRVNCGESIGYGRSFFSKKNMEIAIISVGYADGFSRSLSNKGFVAINGRKAKVCGKVCMDVIMVDISDIKDVKIGDTVELIGDKYSAEEMARDSGTIDYEIVCSISKRVETIFLNDKTVESEKF